MKLISLKIFVRTLLAVCFAVGAGPAFAVDGVWTRINTSSTPWSLATNWADSIVAEGAGATADFGVANATATSARTVTLDVPVILGNLIWGDPTGVNRGRWTLDGASSLTNTLTFNNSGSAAVLTTGPGSTSNPNTAFTNVTVRLADSLNIGAATTAPFTMTGGTISASTAGAKTITNSGNGTGSVTIGSAISDGSGVVAVAQNSTSSLLILSGSNVYTGGTTIVSGATLQMGDGGSTGSVAGNILNNGTLVLNRTGTFSANISGSGGLTRTGVSGTLTLEGTNTYQGGTTVSGGTLAINSDANLGEASGTITLNGGTLNVATAAGDVTMSRNLIMGASGGTFAVNSSNNTTTMNGDVSGGGNLAKSSAGRLILNGTGTNIGTLTQNAGTLLINGDFSSATGAVTVNSTEGAPSTFGGAGTVGGNTSLSGAGSKLSPGADSRRDVPNNSTGLLTFSNGGLGGDVTLTLSSVTTAIFELGGTNRGAALDGFDAVNVEGLLTYEGTLTISLIGGFAPAVNDTFNLFDFGSQTGTFGGGVVFTDVGYAGSFDHSTGVLTITAVPEPAVWAFAGMGLVLLVVRRRVFHS